MMNIRWTLDAGINVWRVWASIHLHGFRSCINTRCGSIGLDLGLWPAGADLSGRRRWWFEAKREDDGHLRG